MNKDDPRPDEGALPTESLIERLHRDNFEDPDCEDAFGTLLQRYLPLVEKTVGRFSDALATESDREDLRQEALLAFYRAAMTYDLSKEGVSFGLYAQICMTNRLVSCVRRMKRRAEEETLPLDGDAVDAGDDSDPSALIAERERLHGVYEVIRRVLSPFEETVWQHYVEGRSAREIAARLGKSEKTVTNAVGRIRRKLRAARNEFDF